MIRKLPVLAIATLSACTIPITTRPPMTTPPPPVTVNPQSAKERFVQAAEANGCVVNAQTAPVILADATLSQEDLARIMTELKAEGRGGVAADGQSFTVTTGACA